MSQIFDEEGADITRDVVSGCDCHKIVEFEKLITSQFAGTGMPTEMGAPAGSSKSAGTANSVTVRRHSVIRV